VPRLLKPRANGQSMVSIDVERTARQQAFIEIHSAKAWGDGESASGPGFRTRANVFISRRSRVALARIEHW
jgi:hypothetical protein